MTEITPDDAAAKRAAEQARIRKERREAKIRAGGAARLNKITGLGGRVPDEPSTTPAPVTVTSTSTPSPPAPRPATGHADPEEVDISQHFYRPSVSDRPGIHPSSATPPVDPGALSDAQLRQMMLGFDRPAHGAAPAPGDLPMNPFGAAAGGGQDDPFMKMMSQMMAARGGEGMPGMPPGGLQQQSPKNRPASKADYTWRILHAIFALVLGLYIILTTQFSGSKVQRERTALSLSNPGTDGDGSVVHGMDEGREVFFWMFATAEALLITTRFMLERGKPGGAESGPLWMVAGFLPGPWKGRVETALRYGQVFSSVRRDILVCVFVLGVVSWWRA
ncbi:hypothetical protein ACRALDRAFT_1067668 [Sodiomyces alcalophilus JCM 7366]|uniref:uncharacterized protein n=1 Tax=Sodiomyces alcalophilus JCM 7366 TaxID=591952 RepID=UPI0039B520AF